LDHGDALNSVDLSLARHLYDLLLENATNFLPLYIRKYKYTDITVTGSAED